MKTFPHIVYYRKGNVLYFRTSDNHTGSNPIVTDVKSTLKNMFQFYPKYTLELLK